MSRQYKPFSTQIKNIPLIIYPVKDENPLHEVFKSREEIIRYLEALYESQTSIQKGDYHILFIWNLNKERMADVWVHEMKNWSDSGPLLSCFTFREIEECHDAGIASGDSIIALAREEELRRNSKSLHDYLDRTKNIPKFPEEMQPDTEFI